MQTIPSYTGLPLPDLGAVGLKRKMKPAADLIDEQRRLSAKQSELYHEKLDLTEQIKDAERRHMEALASSYRSGEEPPELVGVEEMRRRISEIERETKAVSDAAAISAEELSQVVIEHREEWDREVQARGEKILQEAQEIAQKLSAKLSEAESHLHLHAWLGSGGQRFSSLAPATISVDNIIYERQRELGLFEEVLG
jgi:hypothetical protein